MNYQLSPRRPAPPRRTAPRRGAGAASDDLSAFNNAIAAGDQYLASGVTDGNVLGEFSSAVQAYQAGASAAVNSLGPEINAQTGGASQALVQQAANIYTTQLSTIGSQNSTQTDATNAATLAHTMSGLYTTAIALPSGPTTAPPVPTTLPPMPTTATPPASSGSSSTVPLILAGVGVIGTVGIIAWLALREPKGPVAPTKTKSKRIR